VSACANVSGALCRAVQAVLTKNKLEHQLGNEDVPQLTRGQLESELSVTNKQIELISNDQRMLRQYIAGDAVTDDGGVIHDARLEAAYVDVAGAGGEQVKRPVVRINFEGEGFETIFTRVDVKNAGTSMIIRVRAGWEELKAELTRRTDGPGVPLKWDTYVCTAAEQMYALEVRTARSACAAPGLRSLVCLSACFCACEHALSLLSLSVRANRTH
jgi:hypothetical protein